MTIILIVDLSVVTINHRKERTNILKALRENCCQFSSFYPANVFFRKESKMKALSDMKKKGVYYSLVSTKRSIKEYTSGK